MEVSSVKFVTKTRSFVNDQNLSDCSFLVGESEQLFYGHKFVLAMNSDVFTSMFYGDLKENEMPIKVPDLTAVGFKNLLNFKIDFPPSELYETFVAADKYLVTSFIDEFFGYIESILNTSNCCLIYDQLIKINKDEESLHHIRKMIKFNSKKAFDNEFFVKISEDTLIDILTIDSLTINEISILKGCSKWIDYELKRRNLESTADNKREIFKKIRHLINFSSIKTDELKNFKEISNLLNFQEIGQLYLLHLFPDDYSSYPFKYERKRKILKLFTIKEPKFDSNWYNYFQGNNYEYRSEMSVTLKSNKEIFIFKILTGFTKDKTRNLSLFINENKVSSSLKLYHKENGINYWEFELNENFRIDPNKSYTLKFRFDPRYFGYRNYNPSCDSILKTGNSDAVLTLNYQDFHCIQELSFY